MTVKLYYRPPIRIYNTLPSPLPIGEVDYTGRWKIYNGLRDGEGHSTLYLECYVLEDREEQCLRTYWEEDLRTVTVGFWFWKKEVVRDYGKTVEIWGKPLPHAKVAWVHEDDLLIEEIIEHINTCGGQYVLD